MEATINPLPFALPDLGEEEITAVSAALRSGWVTTGPIVKEFEQRFAEFIGAGVEAVAVNSATAGLHLALEGAGIGPGDEVLVPTWTFTATAEVVRYLGAEPILVDVDEKSLNIDFADAASKTTDKTVAILPVHFAGVPVDHEELSNFARARQLMIIEDAAHALPAASGDVRVGSGGSAATVFSFYATKTMTTGEGGMLVTRDAALAQRARVMRLHGISRDAFDRYRSVAAPWRYEVVAPGFKYNLTDPAAAMGLVQLDRVEGMRQKRESISGRYAEAFADLELELPNGLAHGEHAWHLYVVRLKSETARDSFIRGLTERGVGTSVHFIPLHLHPYWQQRGSYVPEDFPVASREFKRVVSLPIFSAMSDSQVDRVISAVREVVAYVEETD